LSMHTDWAPFPAVPDDFDLLKQAVDVVRKHGRSRVWGPTTLQVVVEDQWGHCAADSVETARRSPAARRGHLIRATVTLTVTPTTTARGRMVCLVLARDNSGSVAVTSADDVEAAGLLRRIVELLPSRPTGRVPRWLPWLRTQTSLIIVAVIGGVLSAAIASWFGIHG
jgi:hypothetical protein